jgi:hypothetical protein
MAIGTDRAQILDRIQIVGSAGPRDGPDVVNLNVIGGIRSIGSEEVEPADDATPTVVPQTHLAGFRISFVCVYGVLAYGPFQILRSGVDFIRREMIGAPGERAFGSQVQSNSG